MAYGSSSKIYSNKIFPRFYCFDSVIGLFGVATTFSYGAVTRGVFDYSVADTGYGVFGSV